MCFSVERYRELERVRLDIARKKKYITTVVRTHVKGENPLSFPPKTGEQRFEIRYLESKCNYRDKTEQKNFPRRDATFVSDFDFVPDNKRKRKHVRLSLMKI